MTQEQIHISSDVLASLISVQSNPSYFICSFLCRCGKSRVVSACGGLNEPTVKVLRASVFLRTAAKFLALLLIRQSGKMRKHSYNAGENSAHMNWLNFDLYFIEF